LNFGKKKTYTVRLKENICRYSLDFLKGYFLGLMLTDGYLKRKLAFNTTSENLAKNMFFILVYFGFSPRFYLHKRGKLGWKDLHMVNLNKENSLIALDFLNEIIKETKLGKSFAVLKSYEPGEI